MNVEFILDELDRLFPNARCELDHQNNYELAVAVVLSAQTTDKSVNKVTPNLFEAYPTPNDLATAPLKEIESYISTLGLYRNKAKMIQGMAQGMVDRYDSKVPNRMKDLLTLPGVGRKCGNVILSECYGVPALAVDTHVNRVSKRLKLAKWDDTVEQVEVKLKRKIPRDRWIKTHHQMIFFGRYFCKSRGPHCYECPFVDICSEPNKNLKKK